MSSEGGRSRRRTRTEGTELTARLRQQNLDDDDKENQDHVEMLRPKQQAPSNNRVDKVVAAFYSSAKRTSQATFWGDQQQLAECVVKASLRGKGSSSLLLEEKAAVILNSCRALVKDAATKSKQELSSSEKNSLCELVRHNLYVSLHGLRALLCTSLSNNQRDTVLRLLYHTTVTASESISASTDKCATILATVSVAALETLGNTLEGCTISDTIILKCNNNHRVRFPVPVQVPSTAKAKRWICNIPEKQLLEMGIFSILAASRVVFMLLKHPLQKDETNDFQIHCCDNLNHPVELLQVLRSLTVDIAVPWLIVSSQDKKTAIPHCKKLQRILWETANICSIAKESLLLQGDSITVSLLNDDKTMESGLREMLRATLFESACTNAWKVAEAYQRSNGNDSTLGLFHENVGALLDSYATRDAPVAYTEYCAYRALHTGARQQLKNSFSDQEIPSPDKAFLAIFLLALQVRESLERQSMSPQSAFPVDASFSRTISHFSSIMLCAPLEMRLRYYKLFSMIKLHRDVIDTIGDGSDIFSGTYAGKLQIAAKILSDCIGPLCLGLITGKQLEENQWIVGTEIFKQAILAFETIRTECESGFSPSDTVIGAFTKALTNSTMQAPSNCIESAAKFFNVIGKKRLERGGGAGALLPLLHSVQLLIYLAPSLSAKSLGSLKISNRLAFLSTAYTSLNMKDESIIVTVMALSFDVAEASLSPHLHQERLVNVLEHFVGLTHDVISSSSSQNDQSSSQRNALATALVRHLSQREKSSFSVDSSTKQSALPPERTIDLLLDTLADRPRSTSATFEQRCGVAFGLSGILQVMFTKNSVPRLRDMNQLDYQAQKSCLIGTILAKLGQALQRFDRTTIENRAASFLDYSRIGILAESYIQKLVLEDDVARRVVTAAVLTVASVSLICYLVPLEHDSWRDDSMEEEIDTHLQMFVTLAEKFADKATAALWDDYNLSTVWEFTEASLRFSLHLYRYQLSNLLRYQDCIINLDMEALTFLVEGVTETAASSSCLGTFLRQNLVRSLVRLHGHFCRKGEELQALQVAQWTARATQNDDTNPKSWFEAGLLSLMAKDSFATLKNVEHLETAAVATESAVMESEACRLRLFARCTEDVKILAFIVTKLRDIFTSACKKSSGQPVTTAMILFWWLKTTALFGVAECEERSGDLEAALQSIRDCYKECRKLMLLIANSTKTREKDFPSWCQAALTSLPGRCSERQLECLQKSALLYSRLGERKKALDYSGLVMGAVQARRTHLDVKASFPDLIRLSRSTPVQDCLEIRSRRLLLRLKAQASPHELVVQALGDGNPGDVSLSLVQFPRSQSVNCELEVISDIAEIFDMASGFHALSKVGDLFNLVEIARERYSVHIGMPSVSRIIESFTPRKILPQLEYDIMLRDAMYALAENPNKDCRSQAQAIEKLDKITAATSCSALCKAWSYFLLGSLALHDARSSDELFDLWECRSLRGTVGKSIADARRFFSEALRRLGSSCNSFKRNVQRSLALVSGPEFLKDSFCSASLLINASVGAGSRKSVARSLISAGITDRLDKEAISRIYDGIDYHPLDNKSTERVRCFFHELGKLALPKWRYVTAALTSTGELLLTSIEFEDGSRDLIQRVACIFPNLDRGEDLYETILAPLDRIVGQSQAQLSESVDISSVDNRSEKEDCKRQWWDKRKELDSDLEDLLHRVQQRLFVSADAQQVLLGIDSNRIEVSCGNLASRFEAADVDSSAESDHNGYDPVTMKVAELRNELIDSGFDVTALRRMKKRELVALVAETRNQKPTDKAGSLVDEQTRMQNCCTFLILDENLQRFPFEGLPCFSGVTICRLPSLPFALAKLVEIGASGETTVSFDPRRISYILDAESNLGRTRERLVPIIKKLKQRHGNEWKSVVSDVPSADFFEMALTEDQGLLLYFGHGGGQKFFSRRKIEGLIPPKASHSNSRRINSSVVLMGCSSGKLESVNTADSVSQKRVPLFYEPEGVALSYLMAGAPCVVGNLWDVTDHDIDRFSLSLMELIFAGDDDMDSGVTSIAQAVTEARNACKMRYIVGCAPVCYGLPVFKRETRT